MNPNKSMSLSIDSFDVIDFPYGTYRDCLKQTVPENFNFAFDIIDVWGKWEDKIAIEYLSPNGQVSHRVSYSELSRQSTRYANALLSLGLNKGDYVCIMNDVKPEWYFLGLYQLLKFISKTMGAVLPVAAVLVITFWPFIDRKPDTTSKAYRWRAIAVSVFMVILIAMTIWGEVS